MHGDLPWFVKDLKEKDPEFFDYLKQVIECAMTPSALDEKTKYLIVLALDVSKGAAEGVKILSKKAREHGVTEQEIREVVRLAYFVSGMDVIKTSLSAFE
ncbi:carboxymuconolactone decarboxylase family protein [Thermosyntropha sp.]|uniref:carboxymuconolactone decarboxylase family protein n=1 Tax=Thermosyntropha sp. TaxID=2740820 RepID=UPI0025E2EBE8|nr:carboxymuconolactone decarboxylase family protein [Thermosyntropha sp.]MBO8158896.1 carboxymuconolactone decarboxylase family protein [Thermosyntropha sp.]